MTSPTETRVCLLFADVEGSTRLLDQVGTADYAVLLDYYRDTCRATWAGFGGIEVDNAGDGFFVTFAKTASALHAAGEIHRTLVTTPLRVRIGVHTGDVTMLGSRPVGLEVHRAARIAAAGHGGQTLVSEAAAKEAFAAFAMEDLGHHGFKDFQLPVRIFQLGHERFAPLRTVFRTNLAPAPPLYGRDSYVDDVVERITRGGQRLVTIVGPGGIGKTSIALAAAHRARQSFAGGVWFVPLAELTEASLVRLEGGRVIIEATDAETADAAMLLVLDNVEHLLPGAASDLMHLLEDQRVHLLVTSRQRLALALESTVRVEQLPGDAAAELFLARAEAAGAQYPDGPIVREICERLDRLPLALELAASRAALFSLGQLSDRLRRGIDAIGASATADPRQRTLRATIAWSVELLSGEERDLLASLSVFAADAEVEAIEQICRADPGLLGSLADKHLVRRTEMAFGPRFGLLATIREFASELVGTSVSASIVKQRFVDFYESVADQSRERLRGRTQDEWRARMRADIPNLRLAIELLGAVGDDERRGLVVGHVGWYWREAGLVAEATGLLAELIDRLAAPSPGRLAVLIGWSSLTWDRQYLDEALDLARALGDRRAELQCLLHVGAGDPPDGDYGPALAVHEQARRLAVDLGNPLDLGWVDMNLAALLVAAGRPGEALTHAEAALAVCRESEDLAGQAMILDTLAVRAILYGTRTEALTTLHELVELAERAGLEDACAFALGRIALALMTTDPETARLGYDAHVALVGELSLDAFEASLRRRLADALGPPRPVSPPGFAEAVILARSLLEAADGAMR